MDNTSLNSPTSQLFSHPHYPIVSLPPDTLQAILPTPLLLLPVAAHSCRFISIPSLLGGSISEAGKRNIVAAEVWSSDGRRDAAGPRERERERRPERLVSVSLEMIALCCLQYSEWRSRKRKDVRE